MSFRKKNVVLGSPAGASSHAQRAAVRQEKSLPAGIRPSPLDGRDTTSTGTASLDQYLAGHTGIPTGSSLLFEEPGTTDFSGVLLRYYAAEGLVQGHHVHLLGPGEAWRGELPGLAKEPSSKQASRGNPSADKMKIAWRYETLSRSGGRSETADIALSDTGSSGAVFRHSFDLATRLDSRDITGQLHTSQMSKSSSPFGVFLEDLTNRIKTSGPDAVHRVIIPNILSPNLYVPGSSRPSEVLQFLHGFRGLLRQYSNRLTALASLSTTLYPRSSGITRWMELLSDGVFEMDPLQQPVHMQPSGKPEHAAQGMFRVHKLPVYNERGGGLEGKPSQDNLSFRLSSTNGIVILPFSLPPVGDTEHEEKKKTEKEGDLSF